MERKKIRKLVGKQILAGLLVVGMLISSFPVVSEAETATSPEEQFRQLYLRLLETGDHSQQDITDLNLLYMTCYDIMQDVKKNEGFIAYQCYATHNLIQLDQFTGSGSETYLAKFHLGDQEDTGFVERYTKVKEMVAEVQKNLDDKMTDLDKVLWINEYLVEKLYYQDTGTAANHLGGPTLFNGYGVCEGYAAAMMIFLKAEGIPCETVNGGNHEWVVVKIDGQWYHVDPTWDDTRASSNGTHCFLMRNDDEFVNKLDRKHTITASDAMDKSSKTISTSTDYTNWYVHDVWNRMYYYNGYWYYVKDGAVRKNNIQGTDESVVYSGTNLSITGMESGVLSISGSEGAKQFDLREEDDTTDATTGKGTEATTGNTTEKETEVTTGNTAEKETESTIGKTTEKETESTTGNTTEKTTTSTSAASKKIKAAKPVIKSVTNKKKKKIKIVLKKKVAGADGYEVKYSTNKKFKKSVKTVRFTGKSKTISKLKKNKTYYVKVRAYKKDANGTRVYSKYSNVKKVKIKK